MAEGLVFMVKESIDEEVAKKSDMVILKADLVALNSKIDHVEEKINLKITSELKSLFIKILILMITMTGIILRAIN